MACVRTTYDRYERAAELAKQRDLLAAWERDGHLRNMQKLKELGPVALREYVSDVMASEGSFSSSSARTSAAATTAAAATTTGSVGGGAMSGRSGGAVGFDPRGL